MRVLVIQHDHVSPPGAIGERFAERGYDVVEHVVVDADRFHTPDVAADFPDPTAFEAIVPMGAPWSAYDHGTIGSWLLPELDLLRMAHAVGVPVLGICFGGQLLATAHGGAVVRAEAPELGWSEVASDDERVIPGGPWFQWHYDRWQVPPGGRELARNAAASQAFVLGRNLALQFHPELDSAMLTGWLELGGDAKLRESGVDPEALLHRTRERDAESRARAHRLVDGFCDHVATAMPTRPGC
jgi:GMP synthase-like glutamine amidotransferase